MPDAVTTDTIAAIATAPGRGGIGVVRVSGSLSVAVAQALLGLVPKARYAHYGPFYETSGGVLDKGVALYFPAPRSFTGEDVLELQGHGGPVVLDLILERVIALGARLARPGEFSERAFLNDKLDLAQAEAIADLINASSEQAARSAVRALAGDFSHLIHALVDDLISLRAQVEAAIDFPEEEVDFLGDSSVLARLVDLEQQLAAIQSKAHQGALLREGMTVVLAGRPNAGKSSLLNALAGTQSAIVTAIAGTTRDLLREQIHLDGMPLYIVDTAGLRDQPEEIERIGIERAWQAMAQADRILLIVDASTTQMDTLAALCHELQARLETSIPITVVRNKCDLTAEAYGPSVIACGDPVINISAEKKQGLTCLREHLKAVMGFQGATEGSFIARRRHLEALKRAAQQLHQGRIQFEQSGAGELLAEDLRQVQHALGDITGAVSSDALLGEIFSRFCIGK